MITKNGSAKTAATADANTLQTQAMVTQTGMVRGISTPIVPQDVPVVNEMNTPRIKQIPERGRGRLPERFERERWRHRVHTGSAEAPRGNQNQRGIEKTANALTNTGKGVLYR